MKTDVTTRILLTAILLCLVLLIVQQRREAGEAAVAGRYMVLSTRAGGRPAIVRGDTLTGEMWRAADIFKDAHWVPIGASLVPDGAEPAASRYEFMVFPLRLGRGVLIRHDTVTGEVGATKNWDSDELVWVDLTEVRDSADEEPVVLEEPAVPEEPAAPEEPAVPAPTPAGSEGTAAPED